MQKVTMPKREFVEEHRELVRTLRKGSPEARQREAREQLGELLRLRKKEK